MFSKHCLKLKSSEEYFWQNEAFYQITSPDVLINTSHRVLLRIHQGNRTNRMCVCERTCVNI